MQELPKTFCPLKWKELRINFQQNYVYACCKAKPVRFDKNMMEVIDEQKNNLLNGIQDPSCKICWDSENKNIKSYRQEIIKNFDTTKLNEYKNNKTTFTKAELFIGNECNFQCTYCNSKFSSKWESDIKKRPYILFTDKYHYMPDHKEQDVMEKNIRFLENNPQLTSLSIIGGEPFFNKKFFQLIDIVTVENIDLVTNLSCDIETIDKFFSKIHKFKFVSLVISIDSTGENAEFARYGLKFNKFKSNLEYVIKHKPTNLKVVFNSVMSSTTVRDIYNLGVFLSPMLNSDVVWRLTYCKTPRIHSLETLPDNLKQDLISIFSSLESNPFIENVEMIKDVIQKTRFNNTLYNELKVFLKEFSERKNIKIPICLE